MSDFNEERLRHQGLLQEKEQAARDRKSVV